jgi:hypothetical protein
MLNRKLAALLVIGAFGAYSGASLADDIFLDPYWKMPEATFAVADGSTAAVDLSFKRDYSLVDNYNP